MEARSRTDLSATVRARVELRRGPARSNRVIAAAAGCSSGLVFKVRRQLEERGEIPPTPVRRERRKPPRPSPARDAIAKLGLDASARQVADAAQISRQSAYRMLIRLRAQAEPCQRCGKLYVPTPRLLPNGPGQMYCSKRCKDAEFRDARRSKHGPTDAQAAQRELARIYQGVAPMPDFSRGYCTQAGPDKQKFWVSGRPDEREAARHMCLVACPVIRTCQEWAVTLPVADGNIYGGWTRDQRIAEKSARSGETWRLSFPPDAE